MDTTAATAIGATVAAYVQLLKISRPDLTPARAVSTILLMSILSVAVWVFGQTATSAVDASWSFGIFTAIANVSLTAAGTYGLITGGVDAVARARASHANSEPPVNLHTPPPPTRPIPNTPV